MKNKDRPKREFITCVKPFARYLSMEKRTKHNQKYYKLTQKLIKSIWLKAKKVKKLPELVLTIPANLKENYIITCHIIKERKVK